MMRSLLAVVAIAGCARAARPVTTVPTVTAESEGEVERAAPVAIQVRSEYAGPIVVYTVSEGVASRLGDVTGARAATFELPASALPASGVSLVAVPESGDRRATAGPLAAVPGDVIEFVVAADLTTRAARVRR